MDILGIFGLVFAATAVGVLVYEHEMDVLHGPYIEGRQAPRIIAAMFDPVRPLVEAAMARITWRAPGVIYLAAMA